VEKDKRSVGTALWVLNCSTRCEWPAPVASPPCIHQMGRRLGSRGSTDPQVNIRGCIQKFPDWVVTKYMLTTIKTRWEATKSAMEARLVRLTHRIAIQLHLVAESYTICSPRSRRSVRKLLDTP